VDKFGAAIPDGWRVLEMRINESTIFIASIACSNDIPKFKKAEYLEYHQDNFCQSLTNFQ
jgi:hypothetical protein